MTENSPKPSRPPVVLVGLICIRGHCVFTWSELESGGGRSVEILPSHCSACVAELSRQAYRLVYPGAGPKPSS